MFLPGSPCGCCEVCNGPCSDLRADCLEVTFSGFSQGVGNCNECDFLDDAKIILERRGTGPFKISGAIADTKGAGAVLGLTVAQDQETNYYSIASVTLSAQGSGYTQSAAFAYTLTNGVVVCGQEPQVNVDVGVVAPVLSVGASGGVGASLLATTTMIDPTPGAERWGVGAVSASPGGTGYADGAEVTFVDAKAVIVTPAVATINVTRSQPLFSASIEESNPYKYASASLAFTEETIAGKKWWRVTGATIAWQYGVFEVGDELSPSPGTAVAKDGIQAAVEVSAVNESGAITALAVAVEGLYFATNGAIESVTVVEPGNYHRAGGVRSATLVSGGTFANNSACVLTGSVCAACPQNSGDEIVAKFTAGAAEHRLDVLKRDYVNAFPGDIRYSDSTIATATRPHGGTAWENDEFVFQQEHFAASPRCLTTGVATVKKTTCDAPSDQYCDLPQYITLSIEGIPDVLGWRSNNSGVPGMSQCGNGLGAGDWGNVFCGECEPQDGFRVRVVGTQAGVSSYAVFQMHRDDVAILEREEGCGIKYNGLLPTLSSASGGSVGFVARDCGLGEPFEERVAPTLSATVQSGGGTGAVLGVSVYASFQDEDGAKYSVKSVEVVKAGAGYKAGDEVAFTVAAGDTEEIGASGTVDLARLEPTVTASVTGGEGASLGVSLGKLFENGYDVWTVASVEVLNAGFGYANGAKVTFTAAEDTATLSAASGTIVAGRGEPTVLAGVSSKAGVGCIISANIAQSVFTPSAEMWKVNSIAVDDGGLGYVVGDQLDFTVVDPLDFEQASAVASVSAVGVGGAISAISVQDGGAYYRDSGIVLSVVVPQNGGGRYYGTDGSIGKVLIDNEGLYYRDQITTPPLLTRDVSVEITPLGLETTVTIAGPTNTGDTATAEVTKVAGGAVSAISVTSPGSGYAREIFTRVSPEVTATSESMSGTDAVFAVTLSEQKTAENFRWVYHWEVESVSVTSGGTGYAGTEPLTFSIAEGDTESYPAFGSIITGREEPTLSASVSSGSGASLSVSLTKGTDYNNLDVWSVSGVTVAAGGTGYSDGESVTFTVDDGVEVYPASATTKVGREEPDVSAAASSSGGVNAMLAASLTKSGDSWTVSGVTIGAGGSGYSQYDGVDFAVDPPGVTESPAYGYVSAVDQNGAITAVAVSWGGSYYEPNGIIQSVDISPYGGGEYYKSTGAVDSVLLSSGGYYYRSEPTGAAAVDNPYITISSAIGSGAEAYAVIDSDPESPYFGQVTSVDIKSGGSGYYAGGTGWKATIFAELTHRAGECVVASDQFGAVPCNSWTNGPRTAPSLTASIAPTKEDGEPAQFSMQIEESEGTQPNETVWSVTDITISDNGTGYSGAERVAFSVNHNAGDVVASQAAVLVTFSRSQPSVSVSAASGTGAILQANLVQSIGNDGLEVWGVVSVSVASQGEGYIQGEPLVFAAPSVTFASHATATIASVGDNGEITGISITNSGTYFDGSVDSIEVVEGGAYYRAPKLCQGYDPLSVAERVTASPCPVDLLNRQYTMALTANIFPNGVENTGKVDYCLSGPFANSLTIIGSDGDPITCTLAPA